MARSGITEFHVDKAAASLAKRGINPTIEKVRRELGDTGSATTISKHLSDWKKRQAGTHLTKLTTKEMFDEDISEAIKRIYAVLELRASEEFQSEIDRCNKAISSKDDDLKSVTEDLNQVNEHLREVLEKLASQKQAFADKKTEIASIQAKLRSVELELSAANESKNSLSKQVQELKANLEGKQLDLEKAQLGEKSALNSLSAVKDNEINLTKDNVLLSERISGLSLELESTKMQLEDANKKPVSRPFARKLRRS